MWVLSLLNNNVTWQFIFNKSIVFTYELGEKNISFLDTKIKLYKPITTEVYRKEIDTEDMLNFSSIAPTKWKKKLSWVGVYIRQKLVYFYLMKIFNTAQLNKKW